MDDKQLRVRTCEHMQNQHINYFLSCTRKRTGSGLQKKATTVTGHHEDAASGRARVLQLLEGAVDVVSRLQPSAAGHAGDTHQRRSKAGSSRTLQVGSGGESALAATLPLLTVPVIKSGSLSSGSQKHPRGTSFLIFHSR